MCDWNDVAEGQHSLVHAKRGVPGLDEEICRSLPMKPVTSPSPLSVNLFYTLKSMNCLHAKSGQTGSHVDHTNLSSLSNVIYADRVSPTYSLNIYMR
ncbi:hypothetical protein ADUPG1_008332 [Aduncisulcus paluster]|uniref:Uncharacterized protein n=1 Tax=Aduncisulcus paluster TaxID=2918883 RepID=A0ABQ5KSW7_9EUKA|nr:hypothetical protein ADUPG1_008332 [Aduncisulcus paluster]